MYKTAASVIGVLIALMLSLNGILSGRIGSLSTLPVIHTAGLVTVSLFLLFNRERKGEDSVPFYLNLGGVIGVILVLFNNRCFSSLGASLTLSLGIIGQSAGSVLADATGFLGMPRHRFDRVKALSLLILIAGASVMVDNWKGSWFDILLAFSAGGFVVLSLILNNRLSERIGVFHGVRRNYLGGLAGTAVVLLFTGFDPQTVAEQLSRTNPLFFLGGGFLGVLIVSVSNRILPKIPVMYTTLLIFGGQAVTGIIIDLVVSGDFSLRKAAGVLIILGGLFYSIYGEKKARRIGSAA